jgi:hypothetical protein
MKQPGFDEKPDNPFQPVESCFWRHLLKLGPRRNSVVQIEQRQVPQGT